MLKLERIFLLALVYDALLFAHPCELRPKMNYSLPKPLGITVMVMKLMMYQ